MATALSQKLSCLIQGVQSSTVTVIPAWMTQPDNFRVSVRTLVDNWRQSFRHPAPVIFTLSPRRVLVGTSIRRVVVADQSHSLLRESKIATMVRRTTLNWPESYAGTCVGWWALASCQ